MGGKKRSSVLQCCGMLGSPPHGRGKALSTLPVIFFFRITPALAGKRGAGRGWVHPSRDHPRVGGEKLMGRPRRSVGAESPPHRRGKAHHLDDITSERRITPAQAGKSKLALCTPSCPTDHPRACGEKNKELEGVWLPMGSPPHGRGKAFTAAKITVRHRITPAWAGKVQAVRVDVQPAGITPAWAGKSVFPALG